jgi:hypothetical protein
MADMLTVTVGTTDYTFDWISQEIHIQSGTTEITAADLKQAIHDAQDDPVAMPFDPIADFFNPVVLTGTASTFLNVVLRDQWRIDSLAPSGTLTVGDGNVVNVNNGIDIFAPNPLVNMVNNTSQAGVLVQGTGSGLDAAQSTQLLELYKRLGLDAADPVTDTLTGIATQSGGIDIVRSGDGETTSTLTRQP